MIRISHLKTAVGSIPAAGLRYWELLVGLAT